MKFYKSFYIFGLLVLLTNVSFADQVIMSYSSIWPNTLNIAYDIGDVDNNHAWMQFSAKAEKQADGSSICSVYCEATTSDKVLSVINPTSTSAHVVSHFTCPLFSIAASISGLSDALHSKNGGNLKEIYNQITKCSVTNGQIVWPIYDDVYKTYQSTGKDKVIPITSIIHEEKPIKMEPIDSKK